MLQKSSFVPFHFSFTWLFHCIVAADSYPTCLVQSLRSPFLSWADREEKSLIGRGYQRIHPYVSTRVEVGDGNFALSYMAPSVTHWQLVALDRVARTRSNAGCSASLDHIRSTLRPPLIDGRPWCEYEATRVVEGSIRARGVWMEACKVQLLFRHTLVCLSDRQPAKKPSQTAG